MKSFDIACKLAASSVMWLGVDIWMSDTRVLYSVFLFTASAWRIFMLATRVRICGAENSWSRGKIRV